MPPMSFVTSDQLARLIEGYFDFIQGESHLDNQTMPEDKTKVTTAKKVWDREPEPATVAGLMLFLGFNERIEFNDYCTNGAFADVLNRGRLRVEASYEKKLHTQSSAGAIFALKSLGWNEKMDNKEDDQDAYKTLKIELLETGPKLAEDEKSVIL
jgi:hypothetical protein